MEDLKIGKCAKIGVVLDYYLSREVPADPELCDARSAPKCRAKLQDNAQVEKQ